MTNVILIHGAFGHPNENWFPWLKEELEKLGCNVYVPKFPTPENQSLNSWMDVFKDYEKYLNEDTIVVGHSIGPSFLLSVIENAKTSIKAAYFVCGFIGPLEDPTFHELNKTFSMVPFKWDVLKSKAKYFVYHADNDPYLPMQKAEDLAKHLDVNVNVVKGAGHFNEDSGYTKFELLLDDIKKEL